MIHKDLPSPELLRKLLRYEPETGKLFWMERGVSLFNDGVQTAEHTCARWNSRLAGRPAFSKSSHGYLRCSIFYRRYYAHRIIWAMVTSEWPSAQIDHINHDRLDNRIKNLRAVTNKENGKNQSMPCTNTSGTVGVGWHKASGKWRADIVSNGKQIRLGKFTDIKDAIVARKDAEAEYFYHRNHGAEND